MSPFFQAYHVTDAALGYFSPKQSHSLSILRLQSCWELTNHGVVNIGEFSGLNNNIFGKELRRHLILSKEKKKSFSHPSFWTLSNILYTENIYRWTVQKVDQKKYSQDNQVFSLNRLFKLKAETKYFKRLSLIFLLKAWKVS